MKDKILEATLELAYEKGLGRISMSQIAERVNLKKSSLYSHYRSKDEIIEHMYSYFREKAKEKSGNGEVDYGKLVEGRSLREVLGIVVDSYKKLNQDPQMEKFYRVMESERSMSKLASEVMLEETNTMILATRNLFYAMQAKNVAHFDHPDAAALSFAMGVHAVMMFEYDARMAERSDAEGAMEEYLDEFSRVYR